MSDRIFRMGANGLTALTAEPFGEEQELEELIAEHPELLGDENRRWILVRRQQGIAEAAEAGDRWAVDLLLIDQHAVPTLVEVKRGSNTELRRKVVGQMLDYAAHASHVRVDDLREVFEESVRASDREPGPVLAELLDDDDDADADEFWEQVATNLRASKLRLLFVADRIPDELARIVGFLNEQMPNVDVLAVEIRQFRAGEIRTLVPTVIGHAAKRHRGGLGRTLTLQEVINQFPEGAVRDAARRLIDRAREAGATFEPGSRGTSIRGRCSLWPQPVTVAWLFPSDTGWARTRHFSFGAGIFSGYDPPAPAVLCDALLGYAEQFENDAYAHSASSQGVVAWYIEPGDAAKHIGVLCERLERVLAELRAL